MSIVTTNNRKFLLANLENSQPTSSAWKPGARRGQQQRMAHTVWEGGKIVAYGDRKEAKVNKDAEAKLRSQVAKAVKPKRTVQGIVKPARDNFLARVEHDRLLQRCEGAIASFHLTSRDALPGIGKVKDDGVKPADLLGVFSLRDLLTSDTTAEDRGRPFFSRGAGQDWEMGSVEITDAFCRKMRLSTWFAKMATPGFAQGGSGE
jgi:hypothetical protein